MACNSVVINGFFAAERRLHAHDSEAFDMSLPDGSAPISLENIVLTRTLTLTVAGSYCRHRSQLAVSGALQPVSMRAGPTCCETSA